MTERRDHKKDPADSMRRRRLAFDGTRLVLGGPPCSRSSSFATNPSTHFSVSSPLLTPATRTRGKHPRRHREEHYEPASNQLTPAQAFYKMLGIIIVPPSAPNISTPQQEQLQPSFPTSPSASPSPSSTGKWQTPRQHSQPQRGPGFLPVQSARVSGGATLLAPAEIKTVNSGPACCVSGTGNERTAYFKDNYSGPLSHSNCVTPVPFEPIHETRKIGVSVLNNSKDPKTVLDSDGCELQTEMKGPEGSVKNELCVPQPSAQLAARPKAQSPPPPPPSLHPAIQAAIQSDIQPIALPLIHSVAEPLAARPAATSATPPPVTPPLQPSLQSLVQSPVSPAQSPVSPVQHPLAQSSTQSPAPLSPQLSLPPLAQSPVHSPLVHSPVKSSTPLPTPLSPPPLQQTSVQSPVPVQTPSVQSPVQLSTSPPSVAQLPLSSASPVAQLAPEPLAQSPIAIRSSVRLNIQPGVPNLSGSTSAPAGSSDELIQDSAALGTHPLVTLPKDGNHHPDLPVQCYRS
ncbi:proline-rich protein 36-like [Astatotilapia calliptera]|uniref:proline-rich protein 36-like n=1 Tax=Astatotilapia calliptera TaxID=8154 RepID=UPI000E3F8DC6|nr:proline-rich protein 36-like [Astatotilapia calliptera]